MIGVEGASGGRCFQDLQQSLNTGEEPITSFSHSRLRLGRRPLQVALVSLG